MESYGINIPFVQNAMSRNAFKQCKRFLHFVSPDKIYPQGHPRWHTLQKIQPFIDELLKRFRAAFVMGRDMSADESMIKYKGKQVQFV